MKYRLKTAFGDELEYGVIGEPTSVQDASVLAAEDPYQFQWWALGLVNARPTASEQKKGADKGIDGRLFFHDEGKSGKTKQIIFSVKEGQLHANYVRDLIGVIDVQKAAIGVLIAMHADEAYARCGCQALGFTNLPGARNTRGFRFSPWANCWAARQ